LPQKRERPLPAPYAPLEDVPEEDLAAALEVLQQETAHVRHAMGHDSVSEEEYAEAWTSIIRDFIYLPSRQRYDRSNSATNSDRLASIQVRMQWHHDQVPRSFTH
jgi:hypothetical protein